MAQFDLPVDSALVNQVLASIQVEGRLETISEQPMVIVDVAHNVEAAKYLAAYLDKIAEHKCVYGVFGCLKDKDIDGVVAAMADSIERWYLSPLDTPRSASVAELSIALEKHGDGPYSCYDSVAAAIDKAFQQLPEQGILLVFGSFFTVAAAKQYLD